MRLTCDDCGSVQSEANSVCELCGGSLSEERGRAEARTIVALLASAIIATCVLCLLPGAFIQRMWWLDVPVGMYWGFYLGAWLVGSIVVRFYTPRDDYDVGWGHGAYRVDNPFTLRDDMDRTHLGVGLLLFPMGIVSGLWVALFNQLFGRR